MFMLVIGIMTLGMVASVISPYFIERGERKRASWPQTRGKPTRTRVVTDGPTPRFPVTMYIGQCSVEYTVAGKQYSLWAGAGYLDKDSKWIADKMREYPVSSYVVRYNPQDPSDASAERLDGSP